MKRSFRDYHLLEILKAYSSQNCSLDGFFRKYYLQHKQLGSKDRKYITETIYDIIRHKSLLDSQCTKPTTWEKRLLVYREIDFQKILKKTSLPSYIRFSFPKFLYDRLYRELGLKKTDSFCFECNQRAPLTIRINPLKTTKEDLFQALNSLFYRSFSYCGKSSLGIQVHEKINLTQLDLYKKGLFEIQDEASQLVAALVQAKPYDKVLDFCAGSGGKTLGFGHQMQNKGVIYLHDARPTILHQARIRLKRSGLQNIQFASSFLKSLTMKMDWTLLDVPCSGTGTLRRNPDMKWRLTPKMIQLLIERQRDIFKQAFRYVKPGGKIVYATCSVLKSENEDQIHYFKKNFPISIQKPFFSSLPKRGKMDGFFGSVLIKNL